MATPILAITDGTTRISLLGVNSSFRLRDWQPGLPQIKDGGVWVASPMMRGRRPVQYEYENIIDTFTLAAIGTSQDTLIAAGRDLQMLLDKARNYWVTPYAWSPVWIEARGPEETNTRYSSVYHYAIPGLGNPYAQPFFSHYRAGEELTLVIEHGMWTDAAPGLATNTPISSTGVYNAVTYGRDATAYEVAGTLVDEWFVAARHNKANITHIFTQVAGGAFSANLFASPFVAHDLSTNPVGNNDITYCGCDTAVTDSGPFSSLVFDINQIAVYGAGCSAAWQIYAGGAWIALTVCDNTNTTHGATAAPFTVAGVNSVHWIPPSNWGTVAINGITAYWVRILWTKGAGAITVPAQRNRNVYSVTWAGVSVAADVVNGDLPAYTRLLVRGASTDTYAGVRTNLYIDRAVVALRSTSRGADFTPYINLSDEQNPTGVSVAVAGGTTVFGNNVQAPTGRCVTWSPAGPAAWANRLTVTFSDTLAGATAATQWRGDFHVYMRFNSAVFTTGQVRMFLRISHGGTTISSVSTGQYGMLVTAAPSYVVADFGIIHLPLARVPISQAILQTNIELWATATAGGGGRLINFIDLILMPCDEWLGDFQTESSNIASTIMAASYHSYLDIDSVLTPKHIIGASLKGVGTVGVLDNAMLRGVMSYVSSPMMLQTDVAQKLWFLFMKRWTAPDSPLWSSSDLAATVRLQRLGQYKGMRGAE